MKKISWFIIFLFLLSSCTPSYLSQSTDIVTPSKPITTIEKSEDLNSIGNKAEPELIKTPKAAVVIATEQIPTQTQTITPVFDMKRVKIFELMSQYNYLEPYQLSDEYWEKMSERINKYGKADCILPLEFHGDIYEMYDNYAMTEESFLKQITYLMENDYHFVTIHELQGFVSGWLDLPLRSIILTTDPGYLVWESNERIVKNFSELEAVYGYKPHMNTFVGTQGISEEDNYRCKGNICWLSYIRGVESGYFSLGTHVVRLKNWTHDKYSIIVQGGTKWPRGDTAPLAQISSSIR